MPVKSKEPIHVAVIGGGVCGLVAVKSCLEVGLKVTCFEKSNEYGGLWRYRPDDGTVDGPFEPSVMRTTILNTSKELSAFSDLPPPRNLPNFMKHSLYMDYIETYVSQFNLKPHLKLEHQILRLTPEWNGETKQIKWNLHIRDIRNNCTFNQKFDRVMIAVGKHNVPFIPTFPNQHEFKGPIYHSARLKDILHDDRFINKKVLVVGLGNSACDAANDLAIVTDQCYVSCHRGNWFVARLSANGLYDVELKNRWRNFMVRTLPNSVVQKAFMSKIKSRFNHDLLGLTPLHKATEHPPSINDLFPFRVMTGGVKLKSAISSFTENGVIFEGEENEEYTVDSVVMATGYKVSLPFLDDAALGLKCPDHEDEHDLYLNVFAPRLKIEGVEEPSQMEVVKSLAFIGFIQPSGSIVVASELQSRLAAQVFLGKINLPSIEQMLDRIRVVRDQRAKAIRSHSKDQVVGNWIMFLDELAEHFGAKPNLSRMFFKDFPLWKQLIFGPSVPYQYRLVGPNSWDKARDTILTVNERIACGINDGKNPILYKTRRRQLNVDAQGRNGKKL